MIAVLGVISMIVMGISFVVSVLFLLIQGLSHLDVSKILNYSFSTFLVSLTVFFLAITISAFNPLTLFLAGISILSTILWIKKHSKHNIDDQDSNNSENESEPSIMTSSNEHTQQEEKPLEKEETQEDEKQQASINHSDLPTKPLPDVGLSMTLPAPNIHKIRRKLFEFVVFDIETTGLNKREDEIIQISALKYKSDKQIGEFNTFVSLDLQDSIPLDIVMRTGIDDNDLIGAPSKSEALKQFTEFTDNFPLIGHNIFKFDLPFLIEKGFYKKDIEALDTLFLARTKNLGTTNYKLPTLKKYFGIENQSHNALNDCVTNAIVYQHLRDDHLEKVEIKKNLTQFSQNLAGLKFSITGQFKGIDRDEIVSTIKNHGGKYTHSVSGVTNYLIQGTQTARNLAADGISSNERKAQEVISKGSGLKIINFDQFEELVANNRDLEEKDVG